MALRGDVVLLDFPFTDQPARKRRPAVIVQADVYNRLILKTVVVMVTGNLQRLGDPDGASSGLRAPSLISCNNLFTLAQEDVVTTLGQLSASLRQKLDAALKAALELP